MWQHHGSLQCLSGSRLLLLTLGLLLGLSAWPSPAQAQIDPVDDLQQALNLSLPDQTNLTDTIINFRRETLQKKIAKLKDIGQLRRALALEEWKPIDTAMRKEVADKFIQKVQRVIEKGDPTAKMAVANLVAEIGPTIRSVDPNPPNDRAGFVRSLTPQLIELSKDPIVEVQQEALRALGNINPRPADVFKVLTDSLGRDKLGPRRQAAAALGQMVRVVGFLLKRGRTAAGIESNKAEVIEVSRAAAAGASYGLSDLDPQVRRYCLEAIDEAARAVTDLIGDPIIRKEYPPEGRPLTDDEKKQVLDAQADVQRGETELKDVFKVFQQEGAAIAKQLYAAEPAVAAEAIKALEDIATARLRQLRRSLSVPLLSKADEVDRRKSLQAMDPMAFFLQDNHLEAISRLLRAPAPRLRRTAVEVLELLGDAARPALPAIADALADPDRFVRWGAARAIAYIGPREAPFAVEALGRLLCDDDDNIRLQAAVTLEAMGPIAQGALPALLKAITTGDAETRVAAIYVLVTMGAQPAAPAVPGLIESLTSTDPRVRRAAADVLGRLGPVAAPAVPALRKALEDEDQEARINASEALLSILTPPE
jgi:HEAT repeat protein